MIYAGVTMPELQKENSTHLHLQSESMAEKFVETIQEHMPKVVTSHQRGLGREDAHLPPCLQDIPPTILQGLPRLKYSVSLRGFEKLWRANKLS
jgi:hypothetical protein